RARHRADQPQILHKLLIGNAYALGTLLDVLIVDHSGNDRAPLGFEFIEHRTQFSFQFRRDVPAHAAYKAERVSLAVAGYLFSDPHYRLSDAPALHEQGVEAHNMASKTDPEQMAVQAFDFEHNRAHIFGPWWRLDCSRRFHCLRVSYAMHTAANATDTLGHHCDIVVSEHGFGQLLDAAMHHEPAILTTPHHLPFDIEPEMGRLIKRWMEWADRYNSATLGRITELILAFLIESFRHMIP